MKDPSGTLKAEDMEVRSDPLDTSQVEVGFLTLLEKYKTEKESYEKKIKEQKISLQVFKRSDQHLQKMLDVKTGCVNTLESSIKNLKNENQKCQIYSSKCEKELAEMEEAKKKVEEELNNMKKLMKEKQVLEAAKEKKALQLEAKLACIKAVILDQAKIIRQNILPNGKVSPAETVQHSLPSTASSPVVQNRSKRKTNVEPSEKQKLQKKNV